VLHMSCPVLCLNLLDFSLGAMARTPLFPHNCEGHDMAGQAVPDTACTSPSSLVRYPGPLRSPCPLV